MTSKIIFTIFSLATVSFSFFIGKGDLQPVLKKWTSSTPVETPKPASPTAKIVVSKPAASAVMPIANLNVEADLKEALSQPTAFKRTRQFYQLLNNLGPKDFPKALQALDTLSSNREKQNDIRRLITAWAEVDIKSAMSYAQAATPRTLRDDLCRQAVRVWVISDPQAAIDWIQTLPDGKFYQQTFRTFIDTLTQNDAEQAYNLVKTLSTQEKNEYFPMIFREWAHDDPLLVAGKALEIPKGDARRNILYSVCHSWAEKDPAAAAKFALALSDKEDEYIISSILQQWAKKDRDQALQFLAKIPNEKAREYALSSILSEWANKDPVGAGNYALAAHLKRSSQAVYRIAHQMAQKDPQAALQWISQFPIDHQRGDGGIQSILQEWTKKDPQAAAAYYSTLPANQQQNLAYSIASSWADKNPEEALKWVESLSGRNRQHALSSVLDKWAEKKPEEAMAYILSKTSGNQQESYLSNAIQNWAQKNSKNALEWALKLPDGKLQVTAVSAAVNQWYEQDPKKATAWIEQVPESPLRESLFPEAIRQLADHDVKTAAQWLSKAPDGKSKDLAISEFSYRLIQSDPQAAAKWVSSIQNASVRMQGITNIAYSWMRQDPEKAKAWISQSELSDAEKKMFMNMKIQRNGQGGVTISSEDTIITE